MTFYQELQLNQAGSKNLLKKSETRKEKLYHMWVYLVKIAVTMAFCFFFVSIFSILFGNENSIVGVVVLLCLMVFRNADLGIHTGQSMMLREKAIRCDSSEWLSVQHLPASYFIEIIKTELIKEI